jgi:hypothetical protein
MGVRGPIPGRSETLVGHAQSAGGHGATKTKAPAAKRRPTWPASNPDWHPTAKAWYESLKKSGQASFYEASDIAYAFFVTEELDDWKMKRRTSAQFFASLLTAMASCLSTEADRRRSGIELTQEEDNEDAGAAALKRYEDMLKSSAPNMRLVK